VSELAALGLLALVVAVAAVGGLVVGRMIATRIDRWQEPARDQATDPATQAATEEPGDDTDPS
jgi:hypothetical protein